jgi:hypothetical protein
MRVAMTRFGCNSPLLLTPVLDASRSFGCPSRLPLALDSICPQPVSTQINLDPVSLIPFLNSLCFGLRCLQPGAKANRAGAGATGRNAQPGASEHLPTGRSTQPGTLGCQPGVLHNRAHDRNRTRSTTGPHPDANRAFRCKRTEIT